MIRIAREADAPRIAALEAAGAHHPWSGVSLAAQLAMPTTLAFLAEADEGELGHILTTVILDEAEVLTVVVHPEARRRGLGKALLVAAMDGWRARGVRRGFLEVREHNPAARALYEGLGWRSCGMRPNYYGPGEHAVLYEVELSSAGR